MENEKCNGFTNYDTYACAVQFQNDEPLYLAAKKYKCGRMLKRLWKENFCRGYSGIRISKVNFQEIFESLNED